jgi:hypothetical protein
MISIVSEYEILKQGTCKRKRKLSYEQAEDLVDYKAALGEVIFYYKCHFCKKHHITSSPPNPEITKVIKSIKSFRLAKHNA